MMAKEHVYRNGFHDPSRYSDSITNAPTIRTTARPQNYRGFQIFKVWKNRYDVVKDGVLVRQMAGPNGARGEIDKFLGGPAKAQRSRSDKAALKYTSEPGGRLIATLPNGFKVLITKSFNTFNAALLRPDRGGGPFLEKSGLRNVSAAKDWAAGVANNVSGRVYAAKFAELRTFSAVRSGSARLGVDGPLAAKASAGAGAGRSG